MRYTSQRAFGASAEQPRAGRRSNSTSLRSCSVNVSSLTRTRSDSNYVRASKPPPHFIGQEEAAAQADRHRLSDIPAYNPARQLVFGTHRAQHESSKQDPAHVPMLHFFLCRIYSFQTHRHRFRSLARAIGFYIREFRSQTAGSRGTICQQAATTSPSPPKSPATRAASWPTCIGSPMNRSI